MSNPKIGIIVGSVREGRTADKILSWLKPIVDARTDLDFEIIDLKDYPLPFFDETIPPGYNPTPKNEMAQKWQAKLAEQDGFIFLVAEYNRGPTAVLKNAIDWAYTQWNRKAAAYVGYGSVGGARAVEQLRTNSVELQMVPVRHGVHIGGADFMGIFMQGKSVADFPYYADNAKDMLDHLAWWTDALRTARKQSAQSKAA